MNNNIELIKNLISHKTEEEWFEFKGNWCEAHEIGEYQHCQIQLQFADRNTHILFGE